jgi:DNA cross-link repair 1B protein
MEKRLISVDRWTSQCQAYFLTHLHSDHIQGLSPTWAKGPLFCSRLTANLFPSKFPNFNLSLLRVLDLGAWHALSLLSPSSALQSRITVEVMAIDAHHCPGKFALQLLGLGSFEI